MKPGVLNLFVRNNQTFLKTLILRDSNQNPIDLTGYTGDMQIRFVPLSPIIIIELSSSNSRIALNSPLGSISLTIAVSDLLPLPIGYFIYDLTLTDASNNSYTILTGNFNIIAGVTEELTTPLIQPTGGQTQTGVYTLQGPPGPTGPQGPTNLPSFVNVTGSTFEVDGILGVNTSGDPYLYIGDWWLQEVRSSPTVNRFRLFYDPDNLEAFCVTPAGNVGIGIPDPPLPLWVNGDVYSSGTYQAASDIRLKKNITHIDNALYKIRSISGVYFNWKPPEERQFSNWQDLKLTTERQAGVLAQEIGKVIPEAVTLVKDIYSINIVAMVALIIEAIKELENKMDRKLEKVNKEISPFHRY